MSKFSLDKSEEVVPNSVSERINELIDQGKTFGEVDGFYFVTKRWEAGTVSPTNSVSYSQSAGSLTVVSTEVSDLLGF